MDFRIIIDFTLFSEIILPPVKSWDLRPETEKCERKFMQSSSQHHILED